MPCCIFVPEIVLFIPLLGTYPVLPLVVSPEGSHHLKALVHHESPVPLNSSGVLKLVHIVRKHEDCKVP